MDGKIDINSYLYKTFPLWDYIHLSMYSCIPFIFMVVINIGIIYHLIKHQQISTISNSGIHSRSISITLVITTFLFLIMSLPSTISFAFFDKKASVTVLNMMDGICFTYHIISFPLYFLTFTQFRKVFITMIKCNNINRRIAPQFTT